MQIFKNIFHQDSISSAPNLQISSIRRCAPQVVNSTNSPLKQVTIKLIIHNFYSSLAFAVIQLLQVRKFFLDQPEEHRLKFAAANSNWQIVLPGVSSAGEPWPCEFGEEYEQLLWNILCQKTHCIRKRCDGRLFKIIVESRNAK